MLWFEHGITHLKRHVLRCDLIQPRRIMPYVLGMTRIPCCRVHAQALLVLDDKDFHERQDMLTLGQHRAIATALNSLVFHTHCPAAQAAQNGARAPTQPPLPAMQGMQALGTGPVGHIIVVKEGPLYLHIAVPVTWLQGCF